MYEIGDRFINKMTKEVGILKYIDNVSCDLFVYYTLSIKVWWRAYRTCTLSEGQLDAYWRKEDEDDD